MPPVAKVPPEDIHDAKRNELADDGARRPAPGRYQHPDERLQGGLCAATRQLRSRAWFIAAPGALTDTALGGVGIRVSSGAGAARSEWLGDPGATAPLRKACSSTSSRTTHTRLVPFEAAVRALNPIGASSCGVHPSRLWSAKSPRRPLQRREGPVHKLPSLRLRSSCSCRAAEFEKPLKYIWCRRTSTGALCAPRQPLCAAFLFGVAPAAVLTESDVGSVGEGSMLGLRELAGKQAAWTTSAARRASWGRDRRQRRRAQPAFKEDPWVVYIIHPYWCQNPDWVSTGVSEVSLAPVGILADWLDWQKPAGRINIVPIGTVHRACEQPASCLWAAVAIAPAGAVPICLWAAAAIAPAGTVPICLWAAAAGPVGIGPRYLESPTKEPMGTGYCASRHYVLGGVRGL
ncbi:hypothetical protein GGX14DRAFT_393281 [Mycena pura]|uniref:Uncharacterized protein n=1 Tax=Mycena pura TaxID=153505 RepID=A0AAD6VHM8_9AGAR|nr:hypothetical protein GGX14DRAFT_393281 [Mycena pura]